jgi:hypothetical protein
MKTLRLETLWERVRAWAAANGHECRSGVVQGVSPL